MTDKTKTTTTDTTEPAFKEQPELSHVIAQHLLSSDGPSQVTVPAGSQVLDIHVLDGRFYVRTFEPIKSDGTTETLTFTPAAVGTKLARGVGHPVVVRMSGLHFFVDD